MFCKVSNQLNEEETRTLMSLLLRFCLSSPLRCFEPKLLFGASLLLALLGNELDDWLVVRLRPWFSDLGVFWRVIDGDGTGSFSLSRRFEDLEKIESKLNLFRFVEVNLFAK